VWWCTCEGWPVRIGDGVVKVAEDRLSVARRGGARGGASTDCLSPRLGVSVILGFPVVTGPVRDGTEGDVEPADQVSEPLGLCNVRRPITAAVGNGGLRSTLGWRVTRPWRGWRGRCPQVRPAGAAVGQGCAVWRDKGHAEPGPGAERGGLDKCSCAVGV
jgi:hypothetical protein